MKTLMGETFIHVSSCEDKVHSLEDTSLVVCPSMSNILQTNQVYEKDTNGITGDDMVAAPNLIQEPSIAVTHVIAEQATKGTEFCSTTLTEGEHSVDVLNFYTNGAILEQLLVEPSLNLPLSQDNFLDVPCENDDVHDNIYIIPLQPLMKDHAICVLESNTCAENRHFLHITSDVDELKLLSSLNTLGYIDFDGWCNLNYLEEKLFAYADLPWF
jgi:hypothetical protein